MIDRERQAEILVDAYTLGDASAARKWRVNRRTVRRYRAAMRVDPELASLVREKKDLTEDELATIRVRFLRRAIARLEAKIEDPEATIHEIAGAVKIVGELHQVSEALGDVGSDEPDPDAAEDARSVEAAHGPH